MGTGDWIPRRNLWPVLSLKLFTRRADALSPLCPAGVAPTWWGCPDGHLGNPCFSSWVSLASHHCLRTTCQEVLIYLCFNQMVGGPYSLVGLTQAVLGPRPGVAPSVVRRGQENSLLPCPAPPQPPGLHTRRGSLALCWRRDMPADYGEHVRPSHWQPVSPSPHLIDAGADL